MEEYLEFEAGLLTSVDNRNYDTKELTYDANRYVDSITYKLATVTVLVETFDITLESGELKELTLNRDGTPIYTLTLTYTTGELTKVEKTWH